MKTKSIWASKTVWFNIIMTIMGIITALQSISAFEQYAIWFITILAIGNVILRVWFTDSIVK